MGKNRGLFLSSSCMNRLAALASMVSTALRTMRSSRSSFSLVVPNALLISQIVEK